MMFAVEWSPSVERDLAELWNTGPDRADIAGGGCIVYYNLKRLNGKWVVEYAGSFDP